MADSMTDYPLRSEANLEPNMASSHANKASGNNSPERSQGRENKGKVDEGTQEDMASKEKNNKKTSPNVHRKHSKSKKDEKSPGKNKKDDYSPVRKKEKEKLCDKANQTDLILGPDNYSLSNDIIQVAVGGCMFEIPKKNLQKAPKSLLAQRALTKNDELKSKSIFYDRDPSVFRMVVDFYRTGELHIPQDACVSHYERELTFWKLGGASVADCCQGRYQAEQCHLANLRLVRKHVWDYDREFLEGKAWTDLSDRIWMTLEFPRYSVGALIWGILHILLVHVSIFLLCIDTHPDFREIATYPNPNTGYPANIKRHMYDLYGSHKAIMGIEIVINFIFSLELLVRLVTSPDKCAFIKSWLMWAELLSVQSQWVVSVVTVMVWNYRHNPALWQLWVAFMILRTFRLCRIIRFLRHFRIARVLFLTIRVSAIWLLLLAILAFIAMVTFATLIYFTEYTKMPNEFTSIAESFWWAMITLTTVGYGDVVPVSGLGYLVAVLCAITGVVLIALSVAAIVSKFLLFHQFSFLNPENKIMFVPPKHQYTHTDKTYSELKKKKVPTATLR